MRTGLVFAAGAVAGAFAFAVYLVCSAEEVR